MIIYLSSLLGLTYAGASVLGASLFGIAFVFAVYFAANLYDIYFDVANERLISKFKISSVFGIILSFLVTADYINFVVNSRDCNIMQAEMSVTYRGFEHNPRTFKHNINVCRNINSDGSFSDFYIDSIRK